MTDYTDIVPDRLELAREPKSPTFAVRSYEKALLCIRNGGATIIARDYYGGDGVPAREWNRVVLTFPLASSYHAEALLDVERLRADLRDGGELSRLIDRIIEGHTAEWDGNNVVGVLTEDARNAIDLLQQLGPYDIDPDGEG